MEESQNSTTPNLWDKNLENYVLRTSMVCLPIGVLACILNTIQICAIIQTKRQNRHKPLTNSIFFILNLAISDALIGLILCLYVLNFVYPTLETRRRLPVVFFYIQLVHCLYLLYFCFSSHWIVCMR